MQTDLTTGVVKLTCPVYEVSVSVANGSMTDIAFVNMHTVPNHACKNATSCSIYLAPGTGFSVDVQSGDDNTGGGQSFSLTCPAGSTESPVTSYPGENTGTLYAGGCTTPGAGITGDSVINASF